MDNNVNTKLNPGVAPTPKAIETVFGSVEAADPRRLFQINFFYQDKKIIIIIIQCLFELHHYWDRVPWINIKQN